MSNSLEARLTRLEAKGNQASRKTLVVGDVAEREAYMRIAAIDSDTTVIITGVPRVRLPEL